MEKQSHKVDKRSQRIGNRIRDIRRQLKISQQELADQIEVTRQQLGRLESGARTLKPGTLEQIARALKVPVSRLDVDADVVDSIAEVVQLLGYQTAVRPERFLADGDSGLVDVVGTMRTGPVTLRVVFKYKPSIDLQTLRAMKNLLRDSEYDKAVFLLEQHPDVEPTEYARKNGLELIQIGDFENQLVDLIPYAGDLIKKFEQEVPHYVDAKCSVKKTQSDSISMSLSEFTDYWLKLEKMPHILLLGEAGVGKSTTCKRIASILAERHQQNPGKNPVPILVALWEFPYVRDITQLVFKELLQHHGLYIPSVDALHRMLSNNRFVLILDGVDEVTPQWDPNVVLNELRAITRVMRAGSPVFLTSRTPVFKDILDARELQYAPGEWARGDDENGVPKLQVVHLEKFDRSRIQAFVKSHDSRNWQKVLEEIDRNHLESLASLPLALNLLVADLFSKDPIITKHTTLVTVLGNAARNWAHREAVRLGMATRDLLRNLETIADKAWREQRYRVRNGFPLAAGLDPADAAEAVPMGAQKELPEHSAYVSVFGVKLEDGEYLFKHRLVLQYLVARKACHEITAGNYKDFSTRWYDPEVARLMAQMWPEYEKVPERLLEWLADNPGSEVRAAAAYLFGYGDKGLVEEKLKEASKSDPHISVRNAATYALARLGSEDDIRELGKKARDPRESVDRRFARLELILLSDKKRWDQGDSNIEKTIANAIGDWVDEELDRYCESLKDPKLEEDDKLPMAEAIGIKGTQAHEKRLATLLEQAGKEQPLVKLSPALYNICADSLKRLKEQASGRFRPGG